MSTGSGSLVDRKHRLVLTNVHVVGKAATVTLHFPREDKGALQVKRDYYVAQPGIRGKVVMREPRADIALVQLDSLPEGVQPVPFAKKSPRPAQQVHSVGNPGASGALWIYSPGKVRQVFHDKWKSVNPGERTVDSHEAMVIETDSPINAGDSGGPLVDDRGVLVGVAHGSSIGARNLSLFIEVSECRTLMEKYYKSIGETWVPEPEPVFQEDLARLPELIKKLSDKEFTVRLQSAQALGTMGADANLAFGALFGALKDSEAVVRRAAADALGNVPPHKGDLAMLCQACKDAGEPMEVRLQAVRSLALLGPEAKSAVPILAERLKDADDNLSQSAFKAIVAVGVEGKDMPLLVNGLKSSSAEIRKLSAEALVRLGPQAKPAVPALIDCVRSSDKALRASAAKALAAIGPDAKQALPAVLNAMKDGEQAQGLDFLAAFLKLGGDTKDASGILVSVLKNGAGEDRKKAIQVAGTLGANGRFAVNELLVALDDDTVRADAVQALVAIVKPSAKATKDGLTKSICQSMTKSTNAKTRMACIEAISEIGHINQPVAYALNIVYQRDPVEENRQAAMQAIQRFQGKN